MQEQTLWLPIFLVLPFQGEEGKEKQEGNVDFGFVKYLKNEKSLYTSLDFFHEQGLVKLYCYGGHVGCEAVLSSGWYWCPRDSLDRFHRRPLSE